MPVAIQQLTVDLPHPPALATLSGPLGQQVSQLAARQDALLQYQNSLALWLRQELSLVNSALQQLSQLANALEARVTALEP